MENSEPPVDNERKCSEHEMHVPLHVELPAKSKSNSPSHGLDDEILNTLVYDGPNCIQVAFGHYLNRSEMWRRLGKECDIHNVNIESVENMRVPMTYFMTLIENKLLPFDITWRDIIDKFDDCAEFIELLKQDRLGNLLQQNSPYEGNLVAILKEHHHARCYKNMELKKIKSVFNGRVYKLDNLREANRNTPNEPELHQQVYTRIETPPQSIVPAKKPCSVFITYAMQEQIVYKKISAMLYCLRENGFTSTADIEEKHFAKKNIDSGEWIAKQFEKATVIVVLLSKSYVKQCEKKIYKKKAVDQDLHTLKIYKMMKAEYKRNGNMNTRFVSVLVSPSEEEDDSFDLKGKLARRYVDKLQCLKLHKQIPYVYVWPRMYTDLLYFISKFH